MVLDLDAGGAERLNESEALNAPICDAAKAW